MKGQRQTAPTAPLTRTNTKSQFLNVDLHVESRQDLASLAAALAPAAGTWQSWQHRRMHFLHGSLGIADETPSDLLVAAGSQLRRLRGSARAAWNGAKVREFDLGIQAGSSAARGECTLSVDALHAACRLGAQIRITVYGPEPSAAANPKSRRKQ
jgi:hypothetical protein